MTASTAPARASHARDLSGFAGLTEQQAAALLESEGYNELPASRRRGLPAIALDLLREPMILMLIGAGTIYLLLGDLREALVLISSIAVVAGIELYQSHKTERALDALRDLSSPRARVVRGGEQRRIPGREVARGDLLLLSEGDRVPADALVLDSLHLSVDESLLTGESAPVRKSVGTESESPTAPPRPGGEDLPYVFSGTLVVAGTAAARAVATGPRTELGKIGGHLQAIGEDRTPLQRQTGRLVRVLAIVGVTLCVLVIVLYGATRGDWLTGLLSGLTLAMALLPEEIPVILTVFLALGAWRMSRQHVLTRRVAAIETLGAATVLCADKTGTLTQNRMTLRRLSASGKEWTAGEGPPPRAFHALLEYAVLASQRDPFDPMEKAIHQLAQQALVATERLHDHWELQREYPLSRELLAMSHVWRAPEGQTDLIAAKGAPEAIADLCHLGPAKAADFSADVARLADQGLRVIGVARAVWVGPDLPGKQHDFYFEPIGLLGLEDPIRPDVPAAVRESMSAGLRVLMITGDYPGTARHIAREVGLPESEVVTGEELDGIEETALGERLRSAHVFARVVPEQKLRLVRGLRAAGEVVAMTGDGVNDAPALKAAHIGIAMGERGTDVAREAADIVLLDDDFSSIVAAVRMGRRIFDNLQKAVAYVLAVHMPIAGMALLPVLFGWPLMLLPLHIVFLELIIDPACSIAFEAEPEEEDVMRRPPRARNAPLLPRRTALVAIGQGLAILGIVFAMYGIALARGQGEEEARALAFGTLIVANVGLILSSRSRTRTIAGSLRTPNRALWWIIGGAAALLALVLAVPVLRMLFRFSALHPDDIAIFVGAGASSILLFELAKLFRRRRPVVEER